MCFRSANYPYQNLKSSMDRFIVTPEPVDVGTDDNLKSSMDRFIASSLYISAARFSYLKSSMDRFIAVIFSHQPSVF